MWRHMIWKTAPVARIKRFSLSKFSNSFWKAFGDMNLHGWSLCKWIVVPLYKKYNEPNVTSDLWQEVFNENLWSLFEKKRDFLLVGKKNWKTVWMLELTPLLFSSWHPYSGSQSLSEHIPAVTGQGVGYILSIIYFESFIFILIVIEKKVHNYCLILPENQCVCQRKAHCCPETALSEWQLSHLSSTNPFLLQIKSSVRNFLSRKHLELHKTWRRETSAAVKLMEVRKAAGMGTIRMQE